MPAQAEGAARQRAKSIVHGQPAGECGTGGPGGQLLGAEGPQRARSLAPRLERCWPYACVSRAVPGALLALRLRNGLV